MLVVSILGLVLDFNITFPLIIIYTGVTLIFVIFYAIIVAKITKKVRENQEIRPTDSAAIKEVKKKNTKKLSW